MEPHETLQYIHTGLHLPPEVFFAFKNLATRHLVVHGAEAWGKHSELAASFVELYGARLWPDDASQRQHLISSSLPCEDGYWFHRGEIGRLAGPVFKFDAFIAPEIVQPDPLTGVYFFGTKPEGTRITERQTLFARSRLGQLIADYLRALPCAPAGGAYDRAEATEAILQRILHHRNAIDGQG